MWWCLSMVALAAGLPAGDGGPRTGPPPGPPDPTRIVERAEELGLPEATVEAMAAVVDAARPALDAARDEEHARHEALRDAMEAADRAAALEASAALAEAEHHGRDLRLGLELDLRQLLTDEQWEQLRPPPPRGPHGPPPGGR